ncbi:MAG: prepilin-type N-terminal cleavage/methylation domain-containing protein [Desulfobacterales bacterium]
MTANVKTLGDSKGFSFIELVVAMFILGVGMAAAVSMHYGTARNNTNGDVTTQATMLAKAQLESLKSRNIDDLDAVPSDRVIAVVNPPEENEVLKSSLQSIPLITPAGQPGGIFRRFWTIENLGTDSRAITVTVEWDTFYSQRRVVISSNTQGNGV